MSFENKLVALVNKDLEIGIAMNAVAHASLAMGAKLGAEAIHIKDYQDKNGGLWPISGMPYIVLRGKPSEIRKAIQQAKEENILNLSFLETMTGGTYQEQMARTQELMPEDMVYYCSVLYGPLEKVSLITKRFSLYK
jgi:hypothetical protein